MIKKNSEAIKVVRRSQTTPSKRMKNANGLFYLGLAAAVLATALTGCASKHSTVEIGLSPERMAVAGGKTVVFEVEPRPHDLDQPWHFQWQTNGQDIAGAQEPCLVLKRVDLSDAKIYRCAVFQTGEFAETNYTAAVGLQVVGKQQKIEMLNVPMPVSGQFQPGSGSPPSGPCCKDCSYYMQLISSDKSIWWKPDAGATKGQFTFTPLPSGDGQLMVVNSGALLTNAPWCGTTNVNFSFPLNTAKRFQFIICFKEKPPTSTQLQFSITWGN